MSFFRCSLARLFLCLAIVIALISTAKAVDSVKNQEQSRSPTNPTNSRAALTAVQSSQPQQILATARRQGFVLPEEVDRADPRQRFLLLTPGGPLLVELRLTIDGRPFSTPREEMVDSILQGLNLAPGQEANWEAVLGLPRLVGGRFSRVRGNPEQLKRTIGAYDINGNGLAERYELRLFLAQSYGGAAFGIMPAGIQASNASTSLFEVLDQNSDSLLSGEELAAIQERLKQRDVDNNEIIENTELATTQTYNRRAPMPAGRSQPTEVILAIGPGTDTESIRRTILARYASGAALAGDKIPDSRSLVTFLDQNANGTVDDNEWQQINDAPPQVTLEVNLGSGEGVANGMKLLALSDELGPAEKVLTFRSENKLTLVFPSCHVELYSSQMVPRVDYQQTAQAMISRLDQDKNGYLEKSELGQIAQGFESQFDYWDANGDGKVYLEEIRSSYEESQRPSWDRVLIGGVDQGRAMFQHLDVNGDNRLSLRELRKAEERLGILDQNANGQVESDELPVTLRVGIGRGTTVYQLLYSGIAMNGGGFVSIGGGQSTSNPVVAAEPRWFSAMDRNKDDDLSPREFLGPAELFAKIDANGDGLVSRDEALATKP